MFIILSKTIICFCGESGNIRIIGVIFQIYYSRDFCFNNGLIMRAVGDKMIISPPLVMSQSEIDELIEKARLCLDLTLEKLGIN